MGEIVMTTSLKSIIETISSKVQFTSSILIDSEGEKVRWFPILECDGLDVIMGILEKGEWVVEEKRGVLVLNADWKYLRVLPLLEKPFTEIREEIIKFLNEFNLTVDINSFFPFEKIIKIGFEQKSNYWAELAFTWYEDLSNGKKFKLKDTLTSVGNEKWASQKLRQKIKKELRFLS